MTCTSNIHNRTTDNNKRPTNIFTEQDHGIVRNGISTLGEIEQTVIVLRFWNQNTLDEIANILNLTWSAVDAHLNSAIQKLRTFCVNNNNFSRFQAVGDLSCLRQMHSPFASKTMEQAA